MARSQKLAVVAAALSSDAREAARLAREMGFDGSQLEVYGAGVRLPDLSETGRRELRSVLTRQDLEIASLRVELGPKGLGPGTDADRLLYNLDRAMEVTAGLAARVLCVDLGPLPEPGKAEVAKPAVTGKQAGLILLPEEAAAPSKAPAPAVPPPDPAFVAQVDAAMGELGAKADRYGVVLALGSELSSFAALDDALRRVRCPWFGVDLDPVGMLRDEWAADEVFSRLGGSIRHVRARDATKGADRRTRPAVIGRGDTDWPRMMAYLDEAGFAGWITIDPTELADRVGAAKAGLARLRAL